MTSRAMTIIAVLVAVGATVIGTVAKVEPTLFLKIPEVGFLFWALLAGGELPPYFDQTPLTKELFPKWAKDGDIILATMPKSGTLWLCQIVFLLTHEGKDDEYGDHFWDKSSVPLFARNPDNHTDIRIEREAKKRVDADTLMQWSSHDFPTEKYHGLNVTQHPKIKYIVSARNGMEVIRSFYPFMNGHSDEFRKMWGGFPPPIKSKEEAVKMLTKEMPDFYFNHVKAWWPFRNEPNVLFVHYADMKHDVRAEIKRIADFLSIDVSPTTEGEETMLDAVVAKSSFDYMQTNSHKFMNNLGTKDEPLHIFKNTSIHINKGKGGGATEFFTSEMKETWDDALSLHWADADLNMVKWAMNGGSIN